MTDTPGSNTPEYTVSELSGALKRTVEDAYGHVRVRGELGRVTRAKSGHLYLDLKDERACLDGVMWKGMAGALSFRPEEGLEVIAEGRLSTFPGRPDGASGGAQAPACGRRSVRRGAQAPAAFPAAGDRRRDLAHRRGDPGHPPPA